MRVLPVLEIGPNCRSESARPRGREGMPEKSEHWGILRGHPSCVKYVVAQCCASLRYRLWRPIASRAILPRARILTD
jgi:hypothetical protein